MGARAKYDINSYLNNVLSFLHYRKNKLEI